MGILKQEDVEKIKKCSGSFWRAFIGICESAGRMEKEEVIDKTLETFRELSKEYRDTEMYVYAVQYSHVLIDQIERSLYPGKPRPEVTRSTQRMNYADFVEYIKNPVPGDMITVLNDESGNLARIKIRTVIDI